MSKIVYITVKTPFGFQESFILTEMLALRDNGADIVIIPRDTLKKRLSHEKAEALIPCAVALPLINRAMVGAFIKYLVCNPISLMKLINEITFQARTLKIALKNLAVLPKALYLVQIDLMKDVSHIHAHWASTTATMAFAMSRLTGIPWSFTAHRWDIREDNIMRAKCRTASFIRVISEAGKEEILDIIKGKSDAGKVAVIHMGVEMPAMTKLYPIVTTPFTILTPANLVEVKGHRYLVESCMILRQNGVKVECLIAGNGPMEEELKKLVWKMDLEDCVRFLGRLSHEKLQALYETGSIDIVVLPSIITRNGEKEGIPVALMEAMSYGIPVISTNTGGIQELIGGGCGIMVEEKNALAIARAIAKLVNDKIFYESIAEKGKKKVQQEFNLTIISKKLLQLFGA